jgi:hypothetical protein
MISIKVAAALGLTGLGASTLVGDAFLLSKQTPNPVEESVVRVPVTFGTQRSAIPRESSSSVDDSTQQAVVLEPIVIRSRPAPRHAVTATPERALVPCSDWRALATGPAGRHVQQLCLADATHR